ncbi:MAG: site-2 protease family protein [Pirellulales bacterium]
MRLHASLLLCAVITVYLCSQTGVQYVAEYSLLGLAILLASVLLHELGHLLAAVQLGGRAECVVLGPLGGLGLPAVPPEPKREVLVALAGPAVNFLVILLVAPPLVIAEVNLGELLLSPLNPRNLFEGETWLVGLRLTCWINCLLLLNLFPAYPLDGGHALAAVLRPAFGRRAAVLIVGSSAMLAAVGFLLMALLLPQDTRLVPSWLPLSLFAIFLFFSAKQQIESWRSPEPEDTVLGYDFSEGYTSLDRSNEGSVATSGLLTRWIEQRRANRRRRLEQIEADEERRVDEVLARLNEVGIEALAAEERRLLERVSKRYRERLESE